MKLSFKDYMIQIDDIKNTKTRRKMNKKSHKGRYYGGEHGMSMTTEMHLPKIFNTNNRNIAGENEEETDIPDEEMEMGMEDELELDDSEMAMDDDLDMDPEMDMEEPEDPNKMGTIRKIDGAHLVYKRKNEEGLFDELWMYKIEKDNDNDTDIRNDIIAGTDIEKGKTKSEDKTQRYKLWTSGNVQFLTIDGLPN